mgnify:CR=1 FL=1
MHVTLHDGFPVEAWEQLIEFYQQKIEGGVVNWELDLRRLRFMNSQALGMIISFNASVINRGGRLRILVDRSSYVDNLIHTTKLNRILDVVYSVNASKDAPT